jgi:hypothetical protein
MMASCERRLAEHNSRARVNEGDKMEFAGLITFSFSSIKSDLRESSGVGSQARPLSSYFFASDRFFVSFLKGYSTAEKKSRIPILFNMRFGARVIVYVYLTFRGISMLTTRNRGKNVSA